MEIGRTLQSRTLQLHPLVEMLLDGLLYRQTEDNPTLECPVLHKGSFLDLWVRLCHGAKLLIALLNLRKPSKFHQEKGS